MNALGDNQSIIAMASAVFSAISIIITVLSMMMAKTLINAQEHTLIMVDVKSDEVAIRASKYAKRTYKIKKGIAAILGLERVLIEFLPPQSIPNGVQLRIALYVENEQSKKLKYKDIIGNAGETGRLTDIIQKAWKLKNVPIIENIECKLIQSKNNAKKLNTMSTDTMFNEGDEMAVTIQMTKSMEDKDAGYEHAKEIYH